MGESMDEYPVVVEIPVRFRDLDAMGHVNNSVYLTYFEEARVKYLEAANYELRDPEKLGFVLAEAMCRYQSPLFFGEKAKVGLRVDEVGTKSFKFVYRVEEAGTNRLVATGYTVQVAYDYGNHRPIPLPEKLLESFERVQGRLKSKDKL